MTVKTARLKDLFPRLQIGGTPSRGNPNYFNGSHVWVSIRDMAGFSQIMDSLERLSDDGIVNSNCRIVRKGSLLFSFKLTIGRVAFAGVDLYTNEAIAAFDPEDAERSGVDLNYLSLILPVIARGDKTRNCMGALLLNKDKIENFVIPLPEKDEQRFIANRLMAKLAALEEARNAAEDQARDVLKLFPAILQEAFKEVADSKPAKLKDVAHIQLGKMLSPKSKTGVSSYPYLRNQNVQWGRIDLDNIAQMDFSAEERNKFSLRVGDLLVCEGGEPGRCAIWRGERQDLFFQKALHRIRPQSDALVPEYLMYWLWHQAQIGAFVDQNAKTTIAHLPVVRLEQLSLPLPGKDTQRRIAKGLSNQLDEVRAVQTTLSEQLRNIETLPSRLLAQEFGDN